MAAVQSDPALRALPELNLPFYHFQEKALHVDLNLPTHEPPSRSSRKSWWKLLSSAIVGVATVLATVLALFTWMGVVPWGGQPPAGDDPDYRFTTPIDDGVTREVPGCLEINGTGVPTEGRVLVAAIKTTGNPDVYYIEVDVNELARRWEKRIQIGEPDSAGLEYTVTLMDMDAASAKAFRTTNPYGDPWWKSSESIPDTRALQVVNVKRGKGRGC